jgi:heptosyltransferase I
MMSAIGDVVHALPVVCALRRRYPAMRLTWVLHPGPATLIDGHPAVDEVFVFARPRGARAVGGFAALRRRLATRRFDLCLDPQVYFKAGVVTALVRAPVKLGFDRARARDLNWLFTTHRLPPRPLTHVQDQFLEFAEYLDAPAEPATWDLGPWPAERPWQRAFYDRFDRPVAAVVVGTSKAEKDWLADRWRRVCDALWSDFGVHPVLVGGTSPREIAAAATITAHCGDRVTSALGSGLRNLVGILDGAALVLTPDTGPLHLAVALDRPAVSLFGFTNPKRVGPWRRFHDLMIDAFGDPDEDYPVSFETRPGRMPRITVDDVLAKVQVWRERYASRATSPAP